MPDLNRKRMRLITSIPLLICDPLQCTHDHVHTVLRGQHPSGALWTKVAEPYPYPVADLSLWHHLQPTIGTLPCVLTSQPCRTLPTSLSRRGQSPSMPRQALRRRGNQLPTLRHEPQTVALHTKATEAFQHWLDVSPTGLDVISLVLVPWFSDKLVAAFGRH